MPEQPDDTKDLSGTEPLGTPPGNLPEWKPTYTPPSTPTVAQGRTPTPATGHHVQQPQQRYERRKRKQRDRSSSAFYLPAWSVGLMLLLVFGIVGAIVLLVITLGGQNAPSGEPRIVIITAEPSSTPDASLATATSGVQPLPSFQGPVPTFGLEGPTLAPIIISPTPLSITIGATVVVNSDQLRIRPQPNLDNRELFFAVEGDQFVVIGGPERGSDLTWWQVEDPDDPSRTGWAAADYLDVAVGG